MSETRSRTSSGPSRFIGGAAISANRTPDSWLMASVSSVAARLSVASGMGPPGSRGSSLTVAGDRVEDGRGVICRRLLPYEGAAIDNHHAAVEQSLVA